MNAGYPAWLLERMLSIPSPSGAEGELADFLAAELRDLGMRTTVDAAGNLVAEAGEVERPRILLLGHLDTAAPPLPVRWEGGTLCGRGAADAKGPLAAAICSAAAARAPARLVVAGAVEEETPGSRGARFLTATQPAPDAIVVAEPTGWGGVGIGYKGRAGVTYEVRRPPVHSSSPEPKAVEAAVDFWRDARSLAEEPADGRRFDVPTCALVQLDGDLERAEARIVFRLPPGFDVDALERRLVAAARGGEVRFDERTPAVRSDRRDVVVRALSAAVREAGARPRLTLKTGTSDMNVVRQSWSVPMAAYGPGDPSLDHTLTERLDVDDLRRAIDVLTTALGAIAAEAAGAAPQQADAEEVTERLRALGYLE